LQWELGQNRVDKLAPEELGQTDIFLGRLAGWQVGRQTLYLDILLVLSGTGVIIIQEVVLAKKTRAGIAPDEALLPLPSAFELNTILKTNSNSYVCFQVLAPEIF